MRETPIQGSSRKVYSGDEIVRVLFFYVMIRALRYIIISSGFGVCVRFRVC